MEITYRDVDYDSEVDCELLSTWNNDPALKHLYNRIADEEASRFEFSSAYFHGLKAHLPTDRPYQTLIVMVDEVPAAHGTFQIDWPNLRRHEPKSAWLALMIGAEAFRGCGLGKRILAELESRAQDAGAARIEIGVFDYNERSLGFFTGRGYGDFER